ncbi:MAG TPA: alcohol dehydrogenase catalytic domain-containing protein [Atribacteraceae bacterium]|nr:alcohol dehydrogenase catalytic domain-containing protein [Atribacteraceae bacterium]
MNGLTMKTWVFYEPESMKLEERPIPVPREDEVLIRVKACGICGSDLAYYWGDSSLETSDGKGPLVLGHEFAGEVVEVGTIPSSKKLFRPGDRVTVNPVQYCNTCEICHRGLVNLCENKGVLGVSQDGGFAEYVISHYQHLYILPDSVSFQAGAFVEPLANAVYALQKLSVDPGNSVVVFGPGSIGLSLVSLIKHSGAGKVVLTGTRDYRLEMGKRMEADVVLNLADSASPYYTGNLRDRIAGLTGGRMADRAIVATGSKEAMQSALAVTGRRSRIVYFGLPGDRDRVEVPALESILWDKTIVFSWLAPFTWGEAIGAISGGLIDPEPLITHRVSLEGLLEGLTIAREKKGNPIKVMVC